MERGYKKKKKKKKKKRASASLYAKLKREPCHGRFQFGPIWLGPS
jgi:hypothetical protein